MGSEGHQDIDLAILTALLKGNICKCADTRTSKLVGLNQGFQQGTAVFSIYFCGGTKRQYGENKNTV